MYVHVVSLAGPIRVVIIDANSPTFMTRSRHNVIDDKLKLWLEISYDLVGYFWSKAGHCNCKLAMNQSTALLLLAGITVLGNDHVIVVFFVGDTGIGEPQLSH